jgi:hypothetical protein
MPASARLSLQLINPVENRREAHTETMGRQFLTGLNWQVPPLLLLKYPTMKKLTEGQKSQIIKSIRSILGNPARLNLVGICWQLLEDTVMKAPKGRRRKRIYWLMDVTIAFSKKVFKEYEKELPIDNGKLKK